MTTKTKQG